MARRVQVFSDEAGCLTFKPPGNGVSRYFMIGTVARADLRYDVTILEKQKAYDYLREDPLRFYRTAWYLHFKFVAPRIVGPLDELLVVASSLQINRKRKLVHAAVSDVVAQVSPTVVVHTAFAQTMSDPCLQVADYLAWAVQRKYETGDDRSYALVKHLIASEFEPFAAERD